MKSGLFSLSCHNGRHRRRLCWLRAPQKTLEAPPVVFADALVVCGAAIGSTRELGSLALGCHVCYRSGWPGRGLYKEHWKLGPQLPWLRWQGWFGCRPCEWPWALGPLLLWVLSQCVVRLWTQKISLQAWPLAIEGALPVRGAVAGPTQNPESLRLSCHGGRCSA